MNQKRWMLLCGIALLLICTGLLVGQLRDHYVLRSQIEGEATWTVRILPNGKKVLLVEGIQANSVGSNLLLSGGWASNTFTLEVFSFPFRKSKLRIPVDPIVVAVPPNIDTDHVTVQVARGDSYLVLKKVP